MPEGDSIFRAAARIRETCAGRVVVEAESRAPGPSFARLAGDTLSTAETHGKNLFLRFSSGLAVHVHLKMLGSIRVVLHDGSARSTPFEYRALFVFADRSIVIRRAPIVRLLSSREVERVRAMLGVDPLAATEMPSADVIAKLRTRKDTLGEALMDQRLIAGVGNVLKSESLFLAKASPFASCASCTDAELEAVVAKVRETMEKSVAKRDGASRHDDGARFVANRRITRERSALGSAGARETSTTTWVYSRRDEPCFVCRTKIAMAYQGDPPRSTYYCPRCQRRDEVTVAPRG